MTFIRSQAARGAVAVLIFASLLAGCGEITGDESSPRWIRGYISVPPVPALNTTFSNPVYFSVENQDGGVAGVELHFSVRGDATVDPASARTDENGYVPVNLTLGDTPERVYITGRIAGTTDSAMVSVVPVRRTLELTPDSMRFLAGCGGGVTARIGPAETFDHDPEHVNPGIRFELSDSSVVELRLAGGTDYRRPKRVVVGKRVGVTDLIASFPGTAPDTTHVEVVAPTPADAASLQVWATNTLQLDGEPGILSAWLPSAEGCRLLGLGPTFVSRDSGVVELGEEGESEEGEPTVQLLPRAVGSTWMVATVGERADSVEVEVR